MKAWERAQLVAFGAEIKRRRVEQDFTSEQLGARAGLSPNFLGAVERGAINVSLSTVLQLARGLDVAPADLFGAEGLSAAALDAGRRVDAIKDAGARAAMIAVIKETARTTTSPRGRRRTK